MVSSVKGLEVTKVKGLALLGCRETEGLQHTVTWPIWHQRLQSGVPARVGGGRWCGRDLNAWRAVAVGHSQGSDESGRTGGVSDPSSKQHAAEALAMNQDAGWECKAELPLQEISKYRPVTQRSLVFIL